ncbi:hypothetical protein ABH973_003755 [Bradyrhizobium ottawaense]
MCCSQTHLMRSLAARSLPLDLPPRAAQIKSKPLLEDMHAWLLRGRETSRAPSDVLKPMNYMPRRWDDFARFLDDGKICLTNGLSAH